MNATQINDKISKLRAKAESSNFPAEAAAFFAKADELAKLLVSKCSKSENGEHDFCNDCCCHGDCRDCGERNPEWTDEWCTYC